MRPALFALCCASLACSSRSAPQTATEGSWRDQLIFIGDDGVVAPIALVRHTDGRAEVKGWLGTGGSWQQVLYHRFSVDGRDAPSLTRSAQALSKSKGTPVRADYTELGDDIDLKLSLHSSKIRLEASNLRPLGRAQDPEGISIYRAGRAVLTASEEVHRGWLVAESTPRDQPRTSHVDYGDFVLAVVADGDQVLLLKQSTTVTGFTHGFALSADPEQRPAAPESAVIGPGRVSFTLAGGGQGQSPRIVDRHVTEGENPAQKAIRYRVLLLAEPAGVAFAIGP